jgi:ATP-binding cassette subfamily F protein 3
MVELTADRLVLVDEGKAVDYNGSIDDYIDFVLGRNQPKVAKDAKPKGKAAAKARDAAAALKKKAAEAEAASARLAAQCSALDQAMFDPTSAAPELAALPMSELASRRAKVATDLAAAEARWVEAAEQLERAAA